MALSRHPVERASDNALASRALSSTLISHEISDRSTASRSAGVRNPKYDTLWFIWYLSMLHSSSVSSLGVRSSGQDVKERGGGTGTHMVKTEKKRGLYLNKSWEHHNGTLPLAPAPPPLRPVKRAFIRTPAGVCMCVCT